MALPRIDLGGQAVPSPAPELNWTRVQGLLMWALSMNAELRQDRRDAGDVGVGALCG